MVFLLRLGYGLSSGTFSGRRQEKKLLSLRPGVDCTSMSPCLSVYAMQHTFQRIIEKALTNLQWHAAVLYLDDIVVFGKTFEEHFKNLNEVMDRLAKAGLKLKPKKCHFLRKKINFLGHVVSKEGIQTDPEKTKAIDQIRIPSFVKEVRSFLGLACYYRKFVKDYSKIAKPLYDLTKQDKEWLWTDDCQRAFEEQVNLSSYFGISKHERRGVCA